MITHHPHCRTPPPTGPYRKENHKYLFPYHFPGFPQTIFDLNGSSGTHDLGQQETMIEPICASQNNILNELLVENTMVKLTIRDSWEIILKQLFIV